MTEKLLAIREKDNVTCALSMIDNGENKRYIFKVNKTIYWYFDTIKEYEDGTVKSFKPPYEIVDEDYNLALDTLMHMFKVA